VKQLHRMFHTQRCFTRRHEGTVRDLGILGDMTQRLVEEESWARSFTGPADAAARPWRGAGGSPSDATARLQDTDRPESPRSPGPRRFQGKIFPICSTRPVSCNLVQRFQNNRPSIWASSYPPRSIPLRLPTPPGLRPPPPAPTGAGAVPGRISDWNAVLRDADPGKRETRSILPSR